ncbi:MAG: hypothetical protein IJZ03_02250 [Clostridia bacterium]|nr:hypothetical protein [Clostridia bacterium]
MGKVKDDFICIDLLFLCQKDEIRILWYKGTEYLHPKMLKAKAEIKRRVLNELSEKLQR